MKDLRRKAIAADTDVAAHADMKEDYLNDIYDIGDEAFSAQLAIWDRIYAFKSLLEITDDNKMEILTAEEQARQAVKTLIDLANSTDKLKKLFE